MTKDTTLTFASLPAEKQAKFELLDDPSQPGWAGPLARPGQVDDGEERDREDDRLFGTRIREAIRVLKRR